jgi:hypothetical protein
VSYAPRPGSKTEALVNAVLAQNDMAIRSAELSTLTGIPAASVQGCLQIAVDAGLVTACKVEVPGKRDCWEYRRGSGMPPPSATPQLDPTRKKPDTATRRAVGPTPPKPTPPEPLLPAVARTLSRAAPTGQPRLIIDQDGGLEMRLGDIALNLTPAQTLALGDFLVCTQPLWRP